MGDTERCNTKTPESTAKHGSRAVGAVLLILLISTGFLAYENHLLRGNVASLQEKLSVRALELESLTREYEAVLNAYNELVAEHRALLGDYEALNESHNTLLRDYSELLQNYTDLSTEAESLMARYVELTMAYASLNATYWETLADYTTLQQQVALCQEGYQALQAEYDELLGEHQQLRTNYSELQANYAELQIRYSKLQSSYSALQASYESVLSDYQALQKSYSALESRYEAICSVIYEPLLSNETITPTLNELRAWLASDNTDELPYIYPDFVCGDFAVMLSLRAKMEHWDMGVVGVLGHDSSGNEFNHAFNAIRCQEGLYYVEPQTDAVFSGPISEGSWYNHPGFGSVYVEIFIIIILYQPPL